MSPRLICLVRRHQWHNDWDEDQHVTVWTCKRCGVVRGSDASGVRKAWYVAGGGGGVAGVG